MKKIRLMVIIIVFLISVSGCVSENIVDDVNLLVSLGFDQVDNENIRVTAVVPLYQPDRKTENETYNSLGKLKENPIVRLNNLSPKRFVTGSLENVLIEDKLAEKGVMRLIDSIRRDPNIGSRVYLLIVDGKAKEILEGDHTPIGTGKYISKQIEHNIKIGMVPKTDIHIFRSVYREEGIDPILPLIEQKGDEINIKGIALFDGDKYVDKLVGQDIFIFKLLLAESHKMMGSYSLNLNSKEYVRIEKVSSRRTYEVQNGMTAPDIKINVSVEAYIGEFTGKRLTKRKIKEIEKAVAKKIKQKGEKYLNDFQEKNIDPLGVGAQVRSRYRNWDQKKWDTLYKEAKITVNPTVKITEYGVYE